MVFVLLGAFGLYIVISFKINQRIDFLEDKIDTVIECFKDEN